MRLPSLLLRVMLSLGLVLNGSGIAFASGHAGLPGHAMAGAEPARHADAQLPCHEEGGELDPAAAIHHAGPALALSNDASSQDDAHPPGQVDPDCCEIGTCRCACMHGAVAAMAMLARGPSTAIRDTAVRPLVSAHPAPALPHLIRPPIG